MSETQSHSEGRASILYGRFEKSRELPALVKWLISKKIVRDRREANAVLIVIVLLASLSAVVIFLYAFLPSHASNFRGNLYSSQGEVYPR